MDVQYVQIVMRRSKSEPLGYQDSDVGSSHESDALVTAATVQGISNLMVESNPTTVDSETDQAAGGVVSFLNVGKKKSYSP